jgi:hypothetical protein
MLIYASSSTEYFLEHGEAFVRSAIKCGHEVLIDRTRDFSHLRSKFANEALLAVNLRYLRLPDLLDRNILMLDIDSIINHPIREIDCELALFFRPWIKDEFKRVLMTASYWTPKAKPFAECIRQKILRADNEWYDDQKIVWETYREIGHMFDVETLDKNFVCYNFDQESPIWTCKGPGRKTNEIYLKRKHACEQYNPAKSSSDKGYGIAGAPAN